MVDLTKEKKKWYQILAPKEFDSIEIGESLCAGPDNLIGKTLILSLPILTNDMGKQGINIVFKVNKVEKEKGLSDIIGYQLTSSYIHRMARREKNKLEESFKFATKEGSTTKIKFLIVTRNKTYRSVLAKLRKKLKDSVADTMAKNEFKSILSLIISGNLQRNLKKELNKVYPIAMLEVKTFERTKGQK